MTTMTHSAPLFVSTPQTSPALGAVSGTPLILLRLEGAALLVAAIFAYATRGSSWAMFAGLFLVPDLSMLGYLGGPRLGAACYNAGHSYFGPAVLAVLGVAASTPMLLSIACIWLAHIGFDRLLGYGLKYATSFGETHLGRRGRATRVERHVP
jgi:Domain of unknown function (DUF4260)